MVTPDNWTVNSYTNDQWQTLVDSSATVATLLVSNGSSYTAEIEMALLDESGAVLAWIVPRSSISGGTSYFVDVRSINVTGTQTLSVKASRGGVTFLASGAT